MEMNSQAAFASEGDRHEQWQSPDQIKDCVIQLDDRCNCPFQNLTNKRKTSSVIKVFRFTFDLLREFLQLVVSSVLMSRRIFWRDRIQMPTPSALCQTSEHNEVITDRIAIRHSEAPIQSQAPFDVQNPRRGRPLVILLGWLTCRERHLEKYRHIYLPMGYDVMTVKTLPVDFLYPKTGGQKIARDMLKYLTSPQGNGYQEILVHLFSVGGYQYGEFIAAMKEESLIEEFQRRIRGCVMDSLVRMDEAPLGVAESLFPRKNALKKLTQSIVRWYISVEWPAGGSIKRSQQQIIDNPLKSPVLLFLSEQDKLSNPSLLGRIQLFERWGLNGISCDVITWPNTKHVSHYVAHPYEYVERVRIFLSKLNLPSQIPE